MLVLESVHHKSILGLGGALKGGMVPFSDLSSLRYCQAFVFTHVAEFQFDHMIGYCMR